MAKKVSGVPANLGGHCWPGGGLGVHVGGMKLPVGNRPSAQVSTKVSKPSSSLEL